MDDDKKTPLSKAFGTDDPTPGKVVEYFPPSNPKDDEFITRYVDADYEYARGNIISATERANEALDDLVQFARAAQSARAYEVLATMIKTISDTQKDLLILAKQNKELKEQERDEGGTVNNNLVLTTDALQQLLKGEGVQTNTRKVG